MHFLRKLTPLVLSTIFFLGIFNVAHADITSNLFGWWKLDDGSGTTAADSSGNSNTGTLSGTTLPSWTSSTKIGPYAINNTVATGGSGGYITTANTVNGTHSDETLAAWVYPTDLTGQSGHNIFLFTQDLWLEVLPNGNFNLHGRDNNDYTYTGASIPLNTWTHLAIVCSDTTGGTGTATFYINGSQVYQVSGGVICYNNLPTTLVIGGYGNGGYGFTGKIDDVRYYGRALTSTDMAQLFAYGADMTSNLVGWWKFNEGSGTTAADSGTGGNSLTFPNGVSWVTGQIGAYAASTSGSTQYALLPSADLGSYPTSGSTNTYDFSFSTWFKASPRSTANVILGLDNDIYTNLPGGYVPAIYIGVDHKVYASMFWHGSVSNQIVTSSSYDDGSWHHLVDTYTNGVEKLYIDGVSVGSQTQSQVGFTSTYYLILGASYMTTSWASSGPIGGTWLFYNGALDDARIYSRALSASDVALLYAYTGAAGFNSTPSWALTSTSFFLHSLALSSGGGTPTYSFSTSTSFKVVGAAGETAVGTSSSASFQVQSGFVRNLYKGPAPSYTQAHYHWRNDDGSETTATSQTGGSQDTAISSISKLSTNRLRIEVSNEGGTIANYSTQQFQLEYGLKSSTCAAISSWTSVGSGGDWDVANSSNLTEGANTTNISVSAGGVSDENHTFISSNAGVKDTSSLVSALSVPSDSFVELEYSIQPTSSATDGGAYCFRVTNAGSPTNYTYSKYPEATVAGGGGSLTFVMDGSSETFPSVTPGTLSATSSIIFVKTTNASGFNVTIQRSDSVGTMSLGSTYIPDKTDWFAPSATTTAGNATASTTQPFTLQFRVRQAGTDAPNYASAWWGTADTTAAALFGGVSSTSQKIINRSTAAAATTTAYVTYDLNVPVSQKNGTYSGSITYTVTANP